MLMQPGRSKILSQAGNFPTDLYMVQGLASLLGEQNCQLVLVDDSEDPDALERARSADKERVIAALEASSWSDHFMPYGPTKFVDGQNTGGRPLMTQVLDKDIKVIIPREYRQAEPMFPLKA